MTHILISTDPNGGQAYLTTNSSQSHYGVPVLRVEADDVSGDFGPADIIHGTMTAADVIAGWAREPERTEEEVKIARQYLSQWPDGPQLWGGHREGAGRPSTGRKRKFYYVTDDEDAQIKQLLDSLRKPSK